MDGALSGAVHRQSHLAPCLSYRIHHPVLPAQRLDAAELLIHRAAWLATRGERFTMEASMAKLFASEVATAVCNDCLQIHGGYGYTREFDIERHLRDVKLCEIGEGTSQVQRMVIAKNLLRD